MLMRSSEMGDAESESPIVSIVLVADKYRTPAGFTPIVKTFDDGSDADLWKDGFGFGIFNRTVRYVAISRQVKDVHSLEVVTDLAIISDKEAVPSNFVCLDFTVDSKERALKKKFLCARFTPRNDALDAVSDVIVLGRSRRAPKGYSLAGEIDGMLIAFKVSTIPEQYGRLSHSQSTEAMGLNSLELFPSLGHHSATDLNRVGQPQAAAAAAVSAFTIKSPTPKHHRGIDGVPFQLSPLYAQALADGGGGATNRALPTIPDLRMPSYTFSLERSIL